MLAGYAIFSGYNVAKVFGATSEKINTTVVNTIGTTIKLYSDDNRKAKIVAIVDAKIFEKVFPIRIVLKIKSGFFKSVIMRIAAAFFLLALCCSLYLFIEVMLVSAAEKNDDVSIKKTSNINSIGVDMFSMFYPKYMQKPHAVIERITERVIKKLFSANEIFIMLFFRISAANNNHIIKVNTILVVTTSSK